MVLCGQYSTVECNTGISTEKIRCPEPSHWYFCMFLSYQWALHGNYIIILVVSCTVTFDYIFSIQVLEGRQQFIEMAGNLIPVTKSGDQLFIDFKAFRENRLPCTVRIRDQDQESAARVAFMKEPKVARGEAPQVPICNLNITLPGWSKVNCNSETLV